jgi:hypothetical protein
MLSHHFFFLVAASLCVSGRSSSPAFYCRSNTLFAAQYSLPPALQAAQDSANLTAIPTKLTDTNTIVHTAGVVDQKAGAPADGTPPGLPQAPTMLTALDGEIMVSNISGSGSTGASHGAGRRAAANYELAFNGTTTDDAAVQGTAYLTFTVVSNASYTQGISECLNFCDRTPGCGVLEPSIMSVLRV